MTIAKRSDGAIRWQCIGCEVDTETHHRGEWLRPTVENLAEVEKAERAHDWEWHTPAALKQGRTP